MIGLGGPFVDQPIIDDGLSDRQRARSFMRSAKLAGQTMTFGEAMKLVERDTRDRNVGNEVYAVAVGDDFAPWVHLSWKRHDKAAIRYWSHVLSMKDQIVGRDVEALELFPSEARLVDTANQFHLFACPPAEWQIPFGAGLDPERSDLWSLTESSFDPDEDPDEWFEIEGFEVEVRRFLADCHHGGGLTEFAQIVVEGPEPVSDWRLLQAAKNEVAGPLCEAIELYPARHRVEVLNSRTASILWACCDPAFCFPIGYSRRTTADGDDTRRDDGSRQRPLGRLYDVRKEGST